MVPDDKTAALVVDDKRAAQMFPAGSGEYMVNMWEGETLKRTEWIRGRRDAEKAKRAWEGR